ncbi:MAG: hypothetical protein AAF604_16775 [Acidobacteriota bacterium]
MRRWLARLAFSLLALAAVYLGAANYFLSSDWGRSQVNRRPEKLTLEWQRARTFLPGVIHLEAVRVAGHSRAVDWSMTADEASLRIGLLGLVRKHFVVHRLDAAGVEVEIDRRPPAAAGEVAAASSVPRRRPWTLRFADVALGELRRARYGELLLDGAETRGEVEGAFTLALRRTVEISSSRLRWQGSRLSWKGEPWLEDLKVDSEVSLGPYEPREHRGKAALAFLAGRLQAAGELPLEKLAEGDQQGADRHLQGIGELAALLQVEGGELRPESRVEVAVDRFEVDAGGGSLAADVAAVLEVEARDGGDRMALGIVGGGLTFHRQGAAEPVLAASSARLAMTSSDLTLASGVRGLVDEVKRFRRARREAGAGTEQIIEVAARDVSVAASDSLIASLDRLRGEVDLTALAARRVVARRVRGRGAHLRWAGGAERGPRPRRGQGWSLELADVALDQVPELSLGPFRLQGLARVASQRVAFAPGRQIDLEGVSLTTADGVLLASGDPVAEALDLEASGDFGPFRFGEDPFRALSGRVQVSGEAGSLGFLRYFMKAAPWLDVQGSGKLQADLLLARGRLAPGGQLAVEVPAIEADFLDYRARGRATVRGVVEEAYGGARADVFVKLDDFSLAALATPDQPYIEGKGFHLTATSEALDLRRPFGDLEAVVDIPESDVPDLRVYNAYLPARSQVEILSGAGRLRGFFELSARDDSGLGRIDLTSDAMRVRFLDHTLGGGLYLKARLESEDLRRRRFDLDRSRLELRDVTLDDAAEGAGADWWVRLELLDGELSWNKPLTLESDARLAMKDTGFLLTLFADKKRFLHWFDRVLDIEDVTGEGRVELGDRSLEIDPMNFAAKHLDLRTRLRFDEGGKLGYLYVKLRGLSAGLELDDKERDFRLLRPKRWYESRPAFPD